MHLVLRHSRNSEEIISEFMENLEEMFPGYCQWFVDHEQVTIWPIS